jgi:protein TonB
MPSSNLLADSSAANPLPRAARWFAAALVGVSHVALAWALLQIAPVRSAVAEVAPMFVRLVAPELEAPSAPVVPPPRAPRRVMPDRPLIATPPKPVEPAPAFAAPSLPAPVVDAAPVPEVPSAPPVPEPVVGVAAAVSAAPAPPPAPKTVSIGAVAYRTPPVLHFPPASRRAQEEGRVHVRVLVDAEGLPREVELVRSSGYPRLDDSALATVRATRFRPHTENGVALPFRVVMPLVFELEN